MQPAPLPSNERARVRALKELEILDTESEALYDEVTKLAAQICGTPMCLVSLVDEHRQWFKSRCGTDATETPRELAFCAHAILGDTVFEIEDARVDPRFDDNPLVVGAPNVVFYAGTPLELDDGLNLGTLCVIDHVPRKLSDAQREALQCLGNQVVAHLRLRRANAQLQRALQARSSFLASMSHEIRTPMNGIVGITDLLMDLVRDPETSEGLKTIRNCSDLLLTILNDILDFSKIESGKLELEAQPYCLREVVGHVRDVLLPMAKQKGLALLVTGAAGPDWVVGDSTRVSQVLMNLVGNALKFTERGTVELSVSSQPNGPRRVALTFAVRDEGIGIAEETQRRLFASFSQGDASTTRKYGGTGLGLAISKGLVEAMGGHIWVDSEVGKGSTFAFTLECDVAAVPANDQARELIDEPGMLAQSHPMRILIAEDNRVNQVVALGLLAKLGYQADMAANGREAVEMATANRYDLILMDCHMPHMDGFEASERICAALEAEERPKIYALTAAVMEDERARCVAAGMDAVLEKPITAAKLRAALAACPVLPVRATG